MYYIKDAWPLIPSKKNSSSLRTHLSHRSCHFLKQFWKSSFASVFSCAILAASMSWIDSKRLPLMVILTLGKSQKSHGARSGEKGGWGHTVIFLFDRNCCSYCSTVKTHGTNFALTRLMFKSVVKMFWVET